MTPTACRRSSAILLGFCLLSFALAQGGLRALAQSDDEAAVRSLVERYFEAWRKEDLDAAAGLWSEKSPDLAAGKSRLQTLFSANDRIEVRNLQLRRLAVEGERASTLATFELNPIEVGTSKPAAPGNGKTIRAMSFVKEAGGWKVWSEAAAEEELAARLVAAQSDEERQALLAAEKETVTAELRKALVARSDALRTKGNYPQALIVLELAGRVAEQTGDKAGTAQSRNRMGNIFRLQGKYVQSLDHFRRGLVLCEELRDKDCIADSFHGMGGLHVVQGDYDLAADFYRKSLVLSEETGNQKTIASAHNNLGLVYRNKGDYAQAVEHDQKGLKISEAAGDQVRIADSLHNIGKTHYLRGDYGLALEYFHKSRAMYEALEHKAGMADTINNIGIAYRMRGDNGSAMEYYQKSLALYEGMADKRGMANALSNIGIIHRLQGNLGLALEHYQKSLQLRESLSDRAGVALTLTNLGVVYNYQGDYARALEHYQKSLSLREALGNKSGIALALHGIGEAYRLQGSYGLALEYYRKSLQLKEELGEKADVAKILSGIGATYHAQGEHTRAAEHAERAAGVAREIGYPDALWEALTAAGRARRALGQTLEARKHFEEAISVVEALRAQVAGGGQDRQRFFEDKVSPYYQMVELLAAQGNSDAALDYAEYGKARALLDVLRSGRVNVTKAMTAQEQERERSLKDTLASLNTQISGEERRPQPDQARLTQLKARLEKARLDQEDFITGLYAAHPDLRFQRGEVRPLSLEQAGELLADSETALLEYVVTGETAYLFVLTAGGGAGTGPRKPDLKVYDLKIKRRELAGRVQALRQRIANNDLEYAAPSAELYNLLVGPAKAQLHGKTRLVIIPDDILWETPFQALRSTEGRYLIQTAAVSYAPSLTVLREMIKAKRDRPSSDTLLAMGNPRLADQTVSRSKSVLMSARLEPLPEAERMVKSLAQMYGPAASQVYVGAEAREDVLKREAGKHRTLQLATHGILNNSSPMYSHVVLSQSEGTASEDGLLEAWEIMNLDLRADLAVLSACETARGRIGAGEGVIGLSWALFVAGVPTTVVSQWKVESSSTTALMLEFHRGLRRGAGKSEAMRRAAVKVMADRRYQHPFYWAGFIVVGDGN